MDARRYFALKLEGARGSLASVLERLAAGGDPTLFDFDFRQLATLINGSFPELRPVASALRDGGGSLLWTTWTIRRAVVKLRVPVDRDR